MKEDSSLETNRWTKKFAILPKKVSSGSWVWLGYYHERKIYVDRYGITPISKTYWSYTYSQKEFMIETLKGKVDTPILNDIQQTREIKKVDYIEKIYKRRARSPHPKFK